MYLLFAEAVRVLMEEKSIRYFMYDTYFGGTDGLRLFKKRIGFEPFHVRWRMRLGSPRPEYFLGPLGCGIHTAMGALIDGYGS